MLFPTPWMVSCYKLETAAAVSKAVDTPPEELPEDLEELERTYRRVE
jgi:hypothetical protein